MFLCVFVAIQYNSKIEITFKSTKLRSCFNVKDKIDFEYKHDLHYHTKSPESTCIDRYVRESTRRIIQNKRS